MTEREAFEKWADEYGTGLDNSDDPSAIWQAAIKYERERCAKVCEHIGNRQGRGDYWLGFFCGTDDCAEAIRKG